MATRLRGIGWVLLWLSFIPVEADELQSESLDIDYENSKIEISGRAFGFLPSVFAFKRFDAKVTLEGNSLQLNSADFRFSYLDLSSGWSGRDRKIHNWLEAEQRPEGWFKLERSERRDFGSVAIGQLRLRGETREARFEYQIVEKENGHILEAVAEIDYREWGLSNLRILFFNVNPVMKIRLHIAMDPSRGESGGVEGGFSP